MLTRRQQLKVLSLLVKYLPLFIALMYFINSVLSLLDIYIGLISYSFYCGFVPLFLIYIMCSVLKYCPRYKAYLVYILVNNIVNYLDYELGFSENTLIGWIVVLGLFFSLITYLLFLHIRN